MLALGVEFEQLHLERQQPLIVAEQQLHGEPVVVEVDVVEIGAGEQRQRDADPDDLPLASGDPDAIVFLTAASRS